MFNGRIGFVYQVVHWLVAAAIAKRNPFDLSLSTYFFLYLAVLLSLALSTSPHPHYLFPFYVERCSPLCFPRRKAEEVTVRSARQFVIPQTATLSLNACVLQSLARGHEVNSGQN